MCEGLRRGEPVRGVSGREEARRVGPVGPCGKRSVAGREFRGLALLGVFGDQVGEQRAESCAFGVLRPLVLRGDGDKKMGSGLQRV